MAGRNRQAVIIYRDTVVGLSRQLRESMARVMTKLPEIGERLIDPAWREAIVSEARSWRQSLDAMPDEAPELAKGVHTRTLRWFALAAETGDDLAAGIEGPDQERYALVQPKLVEVTRLGREADQSARFLAKRIGL